MTDDRPVWARRLTNEREARSWSQTQAVRALKAHALPDEKIHASDQSLLRQWKRWEDGEVGTGGLLQADHRQDVRHRHARLLPRPVPP